MKKILLGTLVSTALLLSFAAAPAPATAYPGDCTGYSSSSDCRACCARKYQSHPNCTNACKALEAFDAKAQMSPKPPKRNMSPKRQQ